jgi:hypothetical protein
MPVQESSATALIRFTGLGIICFNPEKQQGEIAILRDEDHQLSIKAQRPVYQDGAESDIVVYRDVVSYEQLPKENVRVEIKAHGAPIAGYQIYQNGGDFDRLGSADRNDLRWLVNIGDLHNDGALSPTSQQPYPLTKVYVSDGLFYTHKLDENLFFEKVEKDANGVEGQREVFGNVAETLGVKIEGDEVSLTIRIGDEETTHSFPRVPGLPYRIEFKNMNYDAGAIFSDMPDYYKYLASPSGKQFELKPISEDDSTTPTQGGSVNQEDFCHPIIFPISSIDQL